MSYDEMMNFGNFDLGMNIFGPSEESESIKETGKSKKKSKSATGKTEVQEPSYNLGFDNLAGIDSAFPTLTEIMGGGDSSGFEISNTPQTPKISAQELEAKIQESYISSIESFHRRFPNSTLSQDAKKKLLDNVKKSVTRSYLEQKKTSSKSGSDDFSLASWGIDLGALDSPITFENDEKFFTGQQVGRVSNPKGGGPLNFGFDLLPVQDTGYPDLLSLGGGGDVISPIDIAQGDSTGSEFLPANLASNDNLAIALQPSTDQSLLGVSSEAGINLETLPSELEGLGSEISQKVGPVASAYKKGAQITKIAISNELANHRFTQDSLKAIEKYNQEQKELENQPVELSNDINDDKQVWCFMIQNTNGVGNQGPAPAGPRCVLGYKTALKSQQYWKSRGYTVSPLFKR